jgi:hypothetical protein
VAYVHRELGMLVQIRPGEAMERIVPELERACGSVPVAAKRLGVSRGSLDRWIVILHLTPTIRGLLERSLPALRGKRRTSVIRALSRCGKRAAHKKD